MKSEFLIAITQLAAERNLPAEVVVEAVEAALASAFKRDHLADTELVVRVSPATGEMKLFAQKAVVEEVEDANKQLSLAEARRYKADAAVGEVLELEVRPTAGGRIAAQTAKQVVMQRLREAEREVVFAEYAGKEEQVLSGVVQRVEGRSVIVDLGRAEAVMPATEQVPTERYRPGQRLKVCILEVGKSAKGPQIVVSRTHKSLLRRLFELEVPEIYNGLVEIKAIAREPGFRSKVAVAARQERVDAVGSCVGMRGMRIQNIVNELHGEKIDVVEWVAEPGAFIAKALAPAQVMQVRLRQEEGVAVVVVPERQLSLAIGREGQNARLAAKLTGWRIDIKSSAEVELLPPAEIGERAAALAAPPAPAVGGPVGLKPLPEPPAVVAAAAAAPPAAGEAAEPEPGAPAKAEAPTLAEALASGTTWKLPQDAAPRSPIRFAEEILPRGGGRGPRGKGRRGERTEEENERRARKARETPLEYAADADADVEVEVET